MRHSSFTNYLISSTNYLIYRVNKQMWHNEWEWPGDA
jgi:hypothetical protein